MAAVCLYDGDEIGRYGFPGEHPFHQGRLNRFMDGVRFAGLDAWVRPRDAEPASPAVLERFHTAAHIERVRAASESGEGFLDGGDTPAWNGIYEAAATVVGAAVDATGRLMDGTCRRAFVPIGGLHHAHPDAASGFCVFNDAGVVIATLLAEYGLERIAYVDIDAHHGDGVQYAFNGDPRVWTADIHEDGAHNFPGTGHRHETGTGPAEGTKLNLPLKPGAGDAEFHAAWEAIEEHLERARPQFILLQCGVDSLRGDPLAHLAFTPAAHRHATRRLADRADELGHGRLLALGGGGYFDPNIAAGWRAVLEALLGH